MMRTLKTTNLIDINFITYLKETGSSFSIFLTAMNTV